MIAADDIVQPSQQCASGVTVAIHQPNYIPWAGYFAKMRACDVFVFLDDVQMPSRGNYVSRVLVPGASEPKWLSVPVNFKPGDRISEVRLADKGFAKKHLGTLRSLYARSPYFKQVFGLLEPLYSEPGDTLGAFNMAVVEAIAGYLQMTCRFEKSSVLKPEGESDDRLISLARLVGADTYVSGKGGQNYQDPAKFAATGIGLDVRVYKPVAYDQHRTDFGPGLSIVDALFNLGPAAVEILKYPALDDAQA